MLPDVYAMIVAFQTMEEFAQQRNARRTTASRASRGETDDRRVAGLGSALRIAAAWLQGRALVLRRARPVSAAPALGSD
jgi:hypothetical protein